MYASGESPEPIRTTPAPPRGYAPRPARCPADRPPFPTVRAKPWRTAPPECPRPPARRRKIAATDPRSEEHTSELQSRENLVCRLLLEKKKKKKEQTPQRRIQT